MHLTNARGVSLTNNERNERHNLIRSILQTNTLARPDNKDFERSEMFASLFALATIDYGVSKKTLASLLGLESAAALDGWEEPENAPALSLRIRTTYLIGLLLSTTFFLENQDYSLYELKVPAELGSLN